MSHKESVIRFLKTIRERHLNSDVDVDVEYIAAIDDLLDKMTSEE